MTRSSRGSASAGMSSLRCTSRVKEEGGFIAEGILLAIVVGAGSNLAADAAKALWNKVLERIRDKRDAVGPEEKPGGEDGH